MVRQRDSAKSRGMALVETALVLGLLLLLVVGGLDFALQFYARHRMGRAAREGARHLAVRQGTASAARTAALNELADLNATFTVTSQEVDQDVTVRVSVLRREVSLNFFPFAEGATIVTGTTMRKEN